MIYYGGGPVSWCSRKQNIVALSSAESEYISSAECCKELIFIKELINELTGKNLNCTLFIDNKSAIDIIKNGNINKRSKHIDVRYHYIKEKYDNCEINVKHCSSNDQVADIFTKPLGGVKFNKFKDLIVS